MTSYYQELQKVLTDASTPDEVVMVLYDKWANNYEEVIN